MSKTSITAIAVAQGYIANDNNRRKHLLDVEALNISKLMVSRSAMSYPEVVGWLLINFIRVLPHRFQQIVLDRITGIPGYSQHCALRKCLIQQQTEKLIISGVEQVVVLAGGFDSLALRMH